MQYPIFAAWDTGMSALMVRIPIVLANEEHLAVLVKLQKD